MNPLGAGHFRGVARFDAVAKPESATVDRLANALGLPVHMRRDLLKPQATCVSQFEQPTYERSDSLQAVVERGQTLLNRRFFVGAGKSCFQRLLLY